MSVFVGAWSPEDPFDFWPKSPWPLLTGTLAGAASDATVRGQFLPRRLAATSSRNKKHPASRPSLRFVPAGAFVRLKPPPFGCQKGQNDPGHNQNRKDETNDLHQRKTPRHELG